MPELPEVETVRRIISPQIIGQTILSTDVRNRQIIAHPDAAFFDKLIRDRKITGMGRRGKYLSISLDNGDRIILHLRMTGQLLVTPCEYPEEKHTHLVIELSGGYQIRYIDMRRLGRFWYIRNGESETETGMERLGFEPLDEHLTADFLKTYLGDRKKPIKEMLQDQSIIAGIGNIYSDEILYAAGIYPGTRCIDLSEDEWHQLAEQIPTVIQKAIDLNRMTPDEYLEGKGKDYRNTPFLKAYGHVRQPCRRCGTIFEKISVGGRNATFCPNCQRKHPD